MTRQTPPPGTDHGTTAVEGRKVAPGLGPLGEFTYSIIDIPARAKPARAERAERGERRGEVRRRTHLRDGVLSEGRGRVVGDCRILNRSALGAHLQLTSDKPLPKSFLLTDPASKARFSARLIWQKGFKAGVRLAAAP